LEARLAPLGAKLTLQVIADLVAGRAHGVKQDKALVTKAPKLTKEHGLIDWTKDAKPICDHIRAMQPWPSAYTFLHSAGKAPLRLIICRASHQGPLFARPAEPGTLATSQQNLVAAAGINTVVHILELQPAGKKRMTAAEFLRGHPIRPGDRLGPET